MTFLADVETAINTGFTGVATAFGGGLLATFRPVFVVGFAIWITLIAYETAFGKSEDGMTYILTKIFRMFLIGTIALYGWPMLAELLDGIRVGFVGNNLISTILENKLINPMIALYNVLFSWYTAAVAPLGFYELAEYAKLALIFVGVFVVYFFMAVMVALVAIVSLAMYLIATCIFILLLAVGPFFMLCLAFPFTQRFFETYIGNVMTSIFAMAFTVLLVFFSSNFFGLTNAGSWVSLVTQSEDIVAQVKSLCVVFCSKAGIAALILYMYYKIFDLASALGGGLNLGNNIIGASRSLWRDAARSRAASAARRSASTSSGPNQIHQGGAAAGLRSAVSRAAEASRAVGSSVARSVSRGGRFGRFAYNRSSR
jgi:type IV secretion system protein VirB6